MWAAKCDNISIILNDLNKEIYCKENWTDESNRPLLCELECGVVSTFDYVRLVRKRSPFFEIINDVISHIVEGGIVMRITKRGFEKAEIQTEFNSATSDDNNFVFGVSHLQTAFYLLMLGYVLAVACFVTEIMCQPYRSKRREPTSTS